MIIHNEEFDRVGLMHSLLGLEFNFTAKKHSSQLYSYEWITNYQSASYFSDI